MLCYHQKKSISSSLEHVSSEIWVSLEPYSKLIQGGRDEKSHLAALQVPPDNQCNSELQNSARTLQAPEVTATPRFQTRSESRKQAQASALLFSQPWSSL